jgi:CHAT domain-containing protein
LYTWLIKPIENDLKQANPQTILYAPDAQLRYIPLAALHDGQQWMIQRYAVNNITLQSLTEYRTQPPSDPRILAGAFADTGLNYPVVVGDRTLNFRGLPFAGKEVANLTAAMPNTASFFDQSFNLATLEPRMNAYNILHFATHAAFVPEQPEKSFILFGDGTPANLRDIGSWTLTNVDLVVLSACETGVGMNALGNAALQSNGIEILGLGYQFQKAGAKAAIASLWQVDDGGTQALMVEFYNALQNGTTKVEALRQAQIALIGGDFSTVGEKRSDIEVRSLEGVSPQVIDRLNHPYYWAPFILIGNGL